MDAYLGIDVGTASARAGLFDEAGRLLCVARAPLRIWRDGGRRAEQSTEDIWAAVCRAVREALAGSSLPPSAIRGIGFDATCSLAVIGKDGRGLPVGPEDDPERDVVMWMDHRAGEQADRINRTGAEVLRYVGGGVSVEMQMPKLLWLKEHRPDVFARIAHVFDLSDYLTWRATGSTARSVCTLTCKWNYLPHAGGWDDDFLDRIGLGALAGERHRRIGRDVLPVGAPVGRGLAAEAAADLGLLPGTPVAASLIDAHAGALGTLGGGADAAGGSTLAFIMGTSSCVMALSGEPVFAPGIWGPYRDALLPGAWLLEGGQSAFGAAIDTLMAFHPAFPAAEAAARAAGRPVLDELERVAVALAGDLAAAARLGPDLTVVPDVLGQRSPRPDPAATAAVAGLTRDVGRDSLLRFFVAILRGLCYGAAEVVDSLADAGLRAERLVVSGGAARSPLLRRILADATGLRIATPETPEPVLLGSAMLGTLAAGRYEGARVAAAAMVRCRDEIRPDPDAAPFHRSRREAYHLLQEAERRIRAVPL